MKKVFLIFMGLIILTGCNKKEEQIDNLSVYEYHYYNEMAKSSNNYVAKYDEKGNFMSLEITTIEVYAQMNFLKQKNILIKV